MMDDWPPRFIRFGVWVHPSGLRDNWHYRVRRRKLGVRWRYWGGRKWVWPTPERC
jgi:hypothetical protein